MKSRARIAGSGPLIAAKIRYWFTASCTTAQAATSTHPERDAGAGSRAAGPSARWTESPEGQRGAAVRDADGGGGEHPLVDGGLPDPPLRQGQPDDGHEERVERRQQDGDRQLPDRMNVLDVPLGLARPAGNFDGSPVAREQQAKYRQVMSAYRQYRRAYHDRCPVDQDHDDDEGSQGSWQLPERPRSDLEHLRTSGLPEDGVHRVRPRASWCGIRPTWQRSVRSRSHLVTVSASLLSIRGYSRQQSWLGTPVWPRKLLIGIESLDGSA